MTRQEVLEDLSRTSIQLLMKEPFYGHFFTGVAKSVTSEEEERRGLQTAFVRAIDNTTVEFSVSRSFWLSLPPEHKYGLVKHEMLHIVLKHITHERNAKMPNRLLSNIAFDLVVNQYIEREQLPEGGVFYEDYREMADGMQVELGAKESADYYYQKLQDMMRRAAEQGRALFGDLIERGERATAGHGFWESFDRLSSAERSLMEAYIEQVLKNTVERVGEDKLRAQGTLPAGVLEAIDALLKKLRPAIDWRRALRLFTETGSKTSLRSTMKRKSKRYGTTPGIRIKSKNHVMVAVDTSGSMSAHEIALLFGEIHHIWKQGAQVTVVEFDTVIHRVYDYRGAPPPEVKGRGGTHFDEVIKLANDKIRPDVTVFFTDAYADKVRIPARKPVMWMITPEGAPKGSPEWNQLEGRVVRMTV